MRYTLMLLVLLLGFAAVNAYSGGDLDTPSTPIKGLDYTLTANISHDPDKSYTMIVAEVENTGFEKIFIHLPAGWEFDPIIYSATGEPIITSKGELNRKYGNPKEKYTFARDNYVFWQPGGFAISRGFPTCIKDPESSWTMFSDCDAIGWYIRPNERLKFTIKMKPSDEEAIIDPFSLEQNRSDIKVNIWNEEFIIYPSNDTPTGFLRAPWIVKGATMVEATPGVISNLSAYSGGFYYDLMKLETPPQTTAPQAEVKKLDSPEWNEWFASSGLFNLRTSRLASLKTEFLPIHQVNKTPASPVQPDLAEELFVPVWYIGQDFYISDHVGTTLGPAIRYSYEWSRNRAISGVHTQEYNRPYVTLTERYGGVVSTYAEAPVSAPAPKLDLTTVPEWYGWFN